MGQIMKILHGLKVAMLMVLVQITLGVAIVLYKLAANDGMSPTIMVAYRFLFATAFMVPLALIIERKKRPKLTWTVMIQAFLCGLFGCSLSQNLYLESLALTSATFISAMNNLNPAITFIMAIIFGLEKLALGTMAGRAKVLGTLIEIGGAMLLTFYKGVQINIGSTHLDLLSHVRHTSSYISSSAHHYLLGAILALGFCICFSLWLNITAKMNQKFPYYYSSTALTFIMGAIQSVVYALCVEKDKSQWKLGWNIRLLTVVYAGISLGLMTCLISWCVQLKGPVYVTAFNPLMLILVAIAGSLFLEEKFFLGTVIGGLLIVMGLYLVLWGEAKETRGRGTLQLVPSMSRHDPENEPMEIIMASSNASTEDTSKE